MPFNHSQIQFRPVHHESTGPDGCLTSQRFPHHGPGAPYLYLSVSVSVSLSLCLSLALSLPPCLFCFGNFCLSGPAIRYIYRRSEDRMLSVPFSDARPPTLPSRPGTSRVGTHAPGTAGGMHDMHMAEISGPLRSAHCRNMST